MPINSAIALPNGKAYLFHGSTYSRYDSQSGRLEDANASIADNWAGLPPTAPDAAVLWGFGKAYFFYGEEYVRYDLRADAVDPDYRPPNPRPRVDAGWPGLPAPVHALVNWGNGKLFGFAGPTYYRYDVTRDRADAGYPKAITGHWPGIWPDRVDAVLYQGGQYAYLFRDEEYTRYDAYADTADLPKPLSTLTLEPVPSGMLAAARDLTLEQARMVMGYLIDQGKLALSPTHTPYVGPWTAITAPAPTTHVVVAPPVIDGVTYEYVNGPAPLIDNVDQRMVVVLYRLARWLNASEPTIERIVHLGIGHGQGAQNDCHNQGRALDFAGVDGLNDGMAFTKRVFADWGNLATDGTTPRLDRTVDPLASQLFLTTYRFGTLECECNGIGARNTWPPKDIGDAGGYVIHPDYIDVPPEVLRLRHQDHIHMQVGPTFV